MTLDVRCSKGTYIRTLAEDIGTRLGCGASLGAAAPHRQRVLSLQGAVTLAQIEALPDADARACCRRPIACWPRSPKSASARRKQRAFCPASAAVAAAPDAGAVRVYGPEPRAFLGSAASQPAN